MFIITLIAMMGVDIGDDRVIAMANTHKHKTFLRGAMLASLIYAKIQLH